MKTAASNPVVLGVSTVLNIVNTQLPFLKAVIPALASIGGPIGLAISAAQGLIEIIRAIPTGGEVSVADQQLLLDEVNAIISGEAFEGAEWKQSGFVWPKPTPPPTTAEIVKALRDDEKV